MKILQLEWRQINRTRQDISINRRKVDEGNFELTTVPRKKDARKIDRIIEYFFKCNTKYYYNYTVKYILWRPLFTAQLTRNITTETAVKWPNYWINENLIHRFDFGSRQATAVCGNLNIVEWNRPSQGQSA